MTTNHVQSRTSGPDKGTAQVSDPINYPNSEAFYRYLYKNTLRDRGFIILILAGFNLLLLIPDILMLKSPAAKVLVTVLRLLLSVGMVLFYTVLKRIKNFTHYARMVSGLEAFAVFVFLFALMNYSKPDFLIQSMGMILLLFVIFMFPNHWQYTVGITFLSICLFLLISSFRIADLTSQTFAAGSVYVVVSAVLSAFGARGTERYRLRHFSSMEALRELSTTDPLTKTYNRSRLEQDGEKWIRICKEHQRPLTLAFLDLDNLKSINDTYGHIVGDRVLIETASRMRRFLGQRDIVCRWGGDEFVILMPGMDAVGAVHIVEQIQDSLTEEPFTGGVITSCSIGIANMDEDSTLKTLIYNADQRMYKAKQKGKNRIEFRN